MSEAAQLVSQARERQGISVGQLAIRAGLSPRVVADVEAGLREPTAEQLSDLLLMCGLALERSATSRSRVRALELDVDASEIEHVRSLPLEERLRRSLAWNGFADQLDKAGRLLRSPT